MHLKLDKGTLMMFERLDEKSKSRMAEIFEEKLEYLVSEIDGCESPIESKFLIDLLTSLDSTHGGNFNLVNIEKQKEITFRRKKYRVDFLVSVGNVNKQTKEYLAIECDGHDFHNKTKEQVRRDKERDRNILKAGYNVMRFTGSEIHECSYTCAQDVLDYFCIKLEDSYR